MVQGGTEHKSRPRRDRNTPEYRSAQKKHRSERRPPSEAIQIEEGDARTHNPDLNSKKTSIYSVTNPGELPKESNNHSIGVMDPTIHPNQR
jgi:hypothetical protein